LELSAVPIEFRCSACGQLLRVPEDAAAKSARCPKCQSLMNVPASSTAIAGESTTPPGPPLMSNPFSSDPAAAHFPPPPPQLPGESPFAGAAPQASLNPYASPASAGLMQFSTPSLPIDPRPVSADTIFNYAWEIWKANLGLLVGVTLVIGAANYAVIIPFNILQVVLTQQKEEVAAGAAMAVGQLCANLVQLYLGIGAVQINLKLARRQPATFGDLFGGMNRFFPLLGGAILGYLALIAGALCLIVPAILMVLAYWPFYFLIIDGKASIIESFSIAQRITHKNWASAFVLWVMSIGISIVGCLAVCIGILFAAPLVSMMFAVAYLMMSGQLVPYGAYPTYPAAQQPGPQTS
jgi:hypothetical protein